MEETMTLSQAADLIIVMTFGVTVITVFFGTVTEALLDLIDTIKKKRKARKEKKAEQSASIDE